MDLDPMLLHCITLSLYSLHLWGILKSISKEKKRKRKKVEKQKRWKRKRKEKILYEWEKKENKKKETKIDEKTLGSLRNETCIHTIMHFIEAYGDPFYSDF